MKQSISICRSAAAVWNSRTQVHSNVEIPLLKYGHADSEHTLEQPVETDMLESTVVDKEADKTEDCAETEDHIDTDHIEAFVVEHHDGAEDSLEVDAITEYHVETAEVDAIDHHVEIEDNTGIDATEDDEANYVDAEDHIESEMFDMADHEPHVDENGGEVDQDINREQDHENNYENEASDATDNSSNEPLYAGASITVGITMTLLLAFIVRHKLTNEAVSDLLHIIEVICPKPNKCIKTHYFFKKFFSFLVTPFKICYYCPQCIYPISDAAVLACEVCKSVFSSVKDLKYFLHISISDQVKALYSRQNFFTNLAYRFTRVKKHQDNYEDIYDGNLYKHYMSTNGILANINNISLTWNVDGLPIFSSSKFSIWPCYFIVNELPYRIRLLKENCIIGGLWFGEEKPNMHVFLKPIVTELLELEKVGIEVMPPLSPAPFIAKVILLAGTCDLPAKCLMLNTIQFNGKFGCNKCLQSGLSFTTSARGHVHIYPYCNEDPTGPLRSSTQHQLDVSEAKRTNTVVNGVKGPSWLRILKQYNIIDGTAIDYMHCVLLGVVRLLLSLWIGSEHHGKEHYIGRKLNVIDQRLMEINPPSVITRKPRKLSTHFKYLKASEYRAFLLYYSIPALHGILPQRYWDHYSLLVISIQTLLKQSISDSQLLRCQQMINRFCQQFEILYGKRYMSANVHLLLHLPDTVRQLGPLWVYSCFYFEGQNGVLKNLVHGTQHVDSQIISSFSYYKNLHVAVEKFFDENSNSFVEVFEHLHSTYRHKIPFNSRLIGNSIYALGKPHAGIVDRLLNASEMEALQHLEANISGSIVEVFCRIIFHNMSIHSCQWNNKSIIKQNNSTVQYVRDEKVEYGIIKKIVYIKSHKTVAIITKLHHSPLQSSTTISHILKCPVPSETSDTVAININNICSPCVFMSFTDVADTIYIAVLPNLLEKD